MPSQFSRLLIEWYLRSHRDLPWRRTTDPYPVWVSEIMLQQTRVAAVLPYYERFLTRYPDIRSLAESPEDELLSIWAGLGYYSRVRNMQRAARNMDGRFPREYDGIRELAGIGDYTAAAIASIAFGLPYAALDGNVLRVLSRVTKESGDISSGVVRARLQSAADTLLDRSRAGEFNQAMMELGATVCLPREPQCLICPVNALCKARKAGVQRELPVRLRKSRTARIERTVFIVERNECLLLWQRPADASLLAGFWELPEPEHLGMTPDDAEYLGSFRHSITRHDYTFRVYLVRSGAAVCAQCKNVVKSAYVPCKTVENMALSTTARKAVRLYLR